MVEHRLRARQQTQARLTEGKGGLPKRAVLQLLEGNLWEKVRNIPSEVNMIEQ